jgi:hypothetical protein
MKETVQAIDRNTESPTMWMNINGCSKDEES